MTKEKSYYKWKKGERTNKVSWVIDYYKNITDEKQYEHACIVEKRLMIFTALSWLFIGLCIGSAIGMSL